MHLQFAGCDRNRLTSGSAETSTLWLSNFIKAHHHRSSLSNCCALSVLLCSTHCITPRKNLTVSRPNLDLPKLTLLVTVLRFPVDKHQSDIAHWNLSDSLLPYPCPHTEFTSALCPETWVVADGKVDIKGDPAWQLASSKVKVEINVQDEMIDAFGNVVKIKQPKKKLSNKEKKARDKMRAARKERGEEVTDSEEDL